MLNTEYFEFMEDEDKTRIKLRKTQKEYFEDDDEIKNETTLDKEYFEKDVKTTEIV